MWPIVALAGPTCTGKTAVGAAAAVQTGAITLPLDQLQRYNHLKEGVGFDEKALRGEHKGYQVLSPWEVSGPAKYEAWLKSTIPVEARAHPVLLEGGCTSYLMRILAAQSTDPILGRIQILALDAPADPEVAVSRIRATYDEEKVRLIVQEVSDLEKMGFISEAGLPFLEECEGLFVHPEREDRNLAWAIRISARVYCPAYLALKGRIDPTSARERIIRNVRDIQVYQQRRVKTCLPANQIIAYERSWLDVDRLVRNLEGVRTDRHGTEL
ncbi:MAG: hypothetical protein HYR72_13090 [Deltaproteobacteria bacterium]|nr:hypothetical protein [Deltaproteobacteria bacterium]MBI3386846.1 hypothetical protein [Deltaproteobacteria bacterium]